MGPSSYKTTCCYCGVGCGVVIHQDQQGRVEVEGDKDHPVNRGMLCSKGINLHHTINDRSDRLLYPEMRYSRSQPRQRVTWDTALERTAEVFKTLIGKYGPDSIAFYASGQCLTEEYYVINKLMKGYVGSNNLDTNSRLCMSSAVAAYKMSLGEDSVPGCYDDIELADCLFFSGSNAAWCHPVLWRRVEAAKRANPRLRIIVSDPRKTQTAAQADIHLQLNPGTDITLHHAIGRCLIEQGHTDSGFVGRHTNGFEDYRKMVFETSLEEAAKICGLSVDDIRIAAGYIGNASGFISLWSMGLNQSAVGVNKNLSLINLNLITGQIGRPGAGPFSLTGQPNAMGGREVGGLSNLLPAHRDLADPADRSEVERYWKVEEGRISPRPGLTATEMFEALRDGKLKAIWIMCTNPLVSQPDLRVVEEGLKNAKFVVVQEISKKADSLNYADVVLPAAAWGEKEGTMTNSERRISFLEKVLEAPGEALPDASIICRLAEKMGYSGFGYSRTEEIFDEHTGLTAGTSLDITGLNYEVLRKMRSVQWPFQNNVSRAGTPRLFTDGKFSTPSGKASIHAVPDSNGSEPPSYDFPLILTTGRIRDQWHTMTKTGKVNRLKQHTAESFLQIHPLDAKSRGIQESDLVEVVSSRGESRVKAVFSEDIKRGVVFMPMHWGKILNLDLHRANNLTSRQTDPVSKEPDFKFTAVQVRRYIKPKQKIIIIGAGAGAHGFIRSYRAINPTDQIEVFSKENLPFYNRVLLPDYINGSLPWDSLIRMSEEEEKRLHVQVHRGVSVERIDRQHKTVRDSHGRAHHYDVLIMATGSRAAVLRDAPPMKGIFTMRSKMDADLFASHIDPAKGKVVIVGGGLLGIELAAALNRIKVEVTIIQRISRLMDRQLDPLGSQLLDEELTNRGIDIYYNVEIERFLGDRQVSGVRLKSGLTVPCQAIVMAVGTLPNIELARDCELLCKRGVVVNHYLQTSDPDIFAIGEIAEFDGFLYGITAAAEQQAAVVARFLAGNISGYYEGSLLMNILKMHGTDLCSLGQVECPDEAGYEEVIFIDRRKRYYKKCIIHHNRLVGAILMGDKSEFAEFRNLIENKIELNEKRLQLLRNGQPAEPVAGRLVCSCGNVGEGNLVKKIEGGCTDLVQLCELTGAGAGCGSCRPEIRAILDAALNPALPETQNETSKMIA